MLTDNTDLKRYKGQQGMTLIEVMVAVIILAFAGVAMIRLLNQSTRVTGQIEQRYMAQLVAENLLVDLSLAGPSLLTNKTGGRNTGGNTAGALTSGTITMGNYHYPWRMTLNSTAQTHFVRADVQVFWPDSSERYLELKGFFSAQ